MADVPEIYVRDLARPEHIEPWLWDSMQNALGDQVIASFKGVCQHPVVQSTPLAGSC